MSRSVAVEPEGQRRVRVVSRSDGRWAVAGVVEALREGLPAATFEDVRQALEVPTAELGRILSIAPRTLQRRRQSGRLQTDESERVLRLMRLVERAAEVLGGPDQARQWFKHSQRALGGSTPLAFCDTEPGAREVEDLLGRIEHGVFS